MDKYQRIYQDVLSDLRTGKYQPGDYLPSDTKFVMRYQVSRETVRKAVGALAEDGYVQRLKGKGTLVLDRKHFAFPVSMIESYRELVEEMHLESTNDVLRIQEQVMIPQELQFEKAASGLSIQVVRRRNVDGDPMVLDYDYINPEVVETVPKSAAQDSLFNYFENQLGLQIDYAVKHITIETASAEDRRLLQISEDIPMVVIRSETHLTDNRLLSFTESQHRADRFTSIEFARRRK